MKTGDVSRRSFVFAGAAACFTPQLGPAQESVPEGGIGGTGIVGVLTDFGSLIVGGRLVQTSGQTDFTDAFGAVTEASLAVGDSLTVEASGPAGALTARRVHVTHPVVGQISALSNGFAVINGVEVILTAQTSGVRVGDRVAVSGLWQGPRVVASRIAPAQSDQDLIAGDVTNTLLESRVGPVVTTRSQIASERTGRFVTVIGSYDAASQIFRVKSAQSERFFGAAGPLVRLAIEGYLEPTSQNPNYRVSGLGHSFSRGLNLADFAQSRTLFSGSYTGTFAADRALTLPEESAARRRVLRGLAQQT